MSVEEYKREVHSSDWYIENESPDLFDNLGIDMTTDVEVTKDKSVIIHLADNEYYEIFPKSPWSLEIKHHTEKLANVVSKTISTISPVSGAAHGPNESIVTIGEKKVDPMDEIKAQVDAILHYERTTTNKAFFESIKNLQNHSRPITIDVPKETKVDAKLRKQLEEVVAQRIKGNLRGAMLALAKS
jgi:hypothetical protein